jgi:hypothetical protein
VYACSGSHLLSRRCLLGSRSPQVDPEQSPDYAGDQAGRHVVELHVTRFLPYCHGHDDKQDQDERDSGDDNHDQRGKHQLSAPLPMI